MLPLVSTSSPSVNGKSVSREKYFTSTGRPSSSTVKSSLFRPRINSPFLSRTVTRTLTTFTSAVILGGAGSCARALAANTMPASHSRREIITAGRLRLLDGSGGPAVYRAGARRTKSMARLLLEGSLLPRHLQQRRIELNPQEVGGPSILSS